MKEDHMLNGQLKPGYNVQIAVEAEYTVGMDIFSDCTDVNTLVSFMNKVRDKAGNYIQELLRILEEIAKKYYQ